MLLVLLPLIAALLASPAAAAAPTDADELPTLLQKYVPGSQEWAASPWMTAPSCRDAGGEFSLWVANVIGDAPDLLKVFNAELFGPDAPEAGKARNDAILDGYRSIATEMQGKVPAGYCVNDMKRWAGDRPSAEPFGFAWGMKDTSIFGCIDTEKNSSVSGRNRWMGAERVPCDGFHVDCDGATDSDMSRCEEWNVFSNGYVARVEEIRARAINTHPAVGTAAFMEKTPVGAVVLTIAGTAALIGVAALVILRRRGVAPGRRKC